MSSTIHEVDPLDKALSGLTDGNPAGVLRGLAVTLAARGYTKGSPIVLELLAVAYVSGSRCYLDFLSSLLRAMPARRPDKIDIP